MAQSEDILEMLTELPTGIAQAGVTLGTGIVGDVAGGLRGAFDIARGRSLNDAVSSIQETQDAVTILPPEDSYGQTLLEELGNLLEPIDRLAQRGYDVAYNVGGPVAATGLQTAVEGGLESLIPLRGGRAVRNVAEDIQNQEPSGLSEALMQASMMQNPATQTEIFTGEGSNLMLAPEVRGKFERAKEIQALPANVANPAFAQSDVFRETGLSIGAEGDLRFEISDDQARLNLTASIPGTATTASKILDHPLLYQAYPDLANVKVNISDNPDASSRGRYSPQTDTIDINTNDPEEIRSILLHELQHAVQRREDFAKGGMPDTARLMEQFAIDQQYDNLLSEFNQKSNKTREKLDESDFGVKRQRSSRDLRKIRAFEQVIYYENIPQPRFLFNTGEYYKYSNEIANQLGRMPSSNPKKKEWIDKAGQIIATNKVKDLFAELQELNAGMRLTDSEIFEIGKQLNEYRRNPQDMKKAVRRAEYQYNKYHNSELGSLFTKLELAQQKATKIRTPSTLLFDSENDFKKYQRLAGEVEARNVQTRMDMTEEQRARVRPDRTEDIERRDQIVIRPTEFQQRAFGSR